MLYMLRYYLHKVQKKTSNEDLVNLARDIVDYLAKPKPTHKAKLTGETIC